MTSAGSQPAAEIYPQPLIHLEKRGYSTGDLRSKGFDDVAGFAPDAVITVCDQAAQESCPVWLGSAVKAHWEVPDPTRHASSSTEMDSLFDETINTIGRRFKYLLAGLTHDRPPAQPGSLLKRIGEDSYGIV